VDLAAQYDASRTAVPDRSGHLPLDLASGVGIVLKQDRDAVAFGTIARSFSRFSPVKA
jgi:hypothetical protein